MEYRRMGSSGLKLSVLSFGAWVTYSNQMDEDAAAGCMAAAREAGVNFFDNAQIYARGKAESIMGAAIKKLGWRRGSFIVSTKFYWGMNDGPNEKNTLNRKYLLEAMDGSLERLQLSHVDLLYCHRPDAETPVGETARAMHDLVASGRAHYWGTSEWPAASIREALQLADRYGWHRPVVEQPQYNVFHRERVEEEYAPLYREFGLGTTTWSPLASGLLTGKYNDGIPEGSRGSIAALSWLKDELTNPAKIAAVKRIAKIAETLGCSTAQLALAWCVKNPNVSSVITGASRVAQVHENMKALEWVPKLTDDVMTAIATAVSG